ncbi:MAG TPA: alpha/beta hydrolase [Candidatus Saccharimonadales bacterium]
MAKPVQNPADYIVPLNMNGLQGRMMRLPAKTRNREILLVYGHHALIERWWGLVQNLNEYGSVTVPDLPGFGGMDSFAKIGQHPSIDNYADYLAAFIKMRYRRRRLTIVGISFGFLVATRMLQKYPELAKKVDLLTSIVGFMHYDDLRFKPLTRKLLRAGSRLVATRPLAFFVRYCCLNRFIITNLYTRLPNGKRRLLEMDPEEFRLTIEFDLNLWQSNDVRTHWLTTSEFLNLDNCKSRVDLPVWHVASREDPYLDNAIVKEHLLVVFKECHQALFSARGHTPGLLADKKELAVLLPRKLRQALSRQPGK